jgi:class 3 adenylate cyclase/tetratricopeptide (TPR) repeat protein
LGEYRRKITAVFADLVGSTGLAERLDPEVFRELLLTFLERMASVVEVHGGKVEHIAGDGVMGVFGADRSHGDDALRAVRAATAMFDELDVLNERIEPKLGLRLGMRIGVNTGTVVVGRTVAGRAVSLGDPMNVAARLQAQAADGEVLIGAETHQLVSREVRAEPAGELELRGRREPMTAYRLLAIDSDRAVPLSERPMIGRGRELGLLTVAFERCAARAAREFISVLGDAGVGKSRLVAELAKRYRSSATLLVGRCLSYGEGITYWPVAEIVRQAAGIADADDPDRARAKLASVAAGDPDGEAIARHLSQLIGIDAAAEPREQSAWALRRLLELAAGSRPLIVVVDDLHWGEPKLLDLLLEVAEEATGAVLIVCMARFDLLERRPEWEQSCPTTIALKPLPAREIEELVELLIGDALPVAFRARLVELAAGNPLFVEQVLHMLVDEGHLRVDGDRWEVDEGAAEIEVPPSIEAILAARIDHLSGPERACAECAAVVGMEFWVPGVSEIVGESASRSLASLRRKLVIEPVRRPGAGEDMHHFRHLLLRDAVYEAIPKFRRAELHQRAGEWLLGWADERLGEVEEIVGYHFEAAARYSSELLSGGGDPDRLAERAVQHLTAAGRRAATREDDHDAAGFFRRAVSLLGEGNPTRLEPLLELGSALVRGGDTAHAGEVVADARRAAASVRDPRLDAEVRTLEVNLRRLTNPRWWAAHGRSEASELARVYRELGDDAGSAKAWHLLGKAHSDRGEQAAAQEAFEHALEYARGREAFGKPLLARQGVSFKLADIAIELEASRLLVWRACRALDVADDDAGLLGSYAKAFAADAAMRATTEAVQVLGGAGVMRDHPVEKWLRDAKVFQIVEGTSEIQRHIVAAHLRG